MATNSYARDQAPTCERPMTTLPLAVTSSSTRSGDEWDPAPAHSAHVLDVCRVLLQELLFHEALDHEETRTDRGDDEVAERIAPKHRARHRDEDPPVDRMADDRISPGGDDLTLRGDEADVAAEAQAGEHGGGEGPQRQGARKGGRSQRLS